MLKTSELVALCKNDLIDIYQHAIGAIKPEQLIKNTLSIGKNRVLTIKTTDQQENIEVDLRDKSLHVIGGGKSVLSMAKGLAEVVKQTGYYTDSFSLGTLSLPIGLRTKLQSDTHTKSLLDFINVDCKFGSRDNMPDIDSVNASKYMMERIRVACDEDRLQNRQPLFVVLISGGGSACLTSPKYIDLEKKLELIKFLVKRGADIVELNKVRSYFSQIKGGGLAAYIFERNPRSQILSLIMSDVVGDPIDYIASGPTVFKSMNSKQAMLDVLLKYKFPIIVEIIKNLETKDHNPVFKPERNSIINHIIGNNKIALRAATQRAEVLGFKVKSLGNELEGSTENIIDIITKIGDEFACKSGLVSGEKYLFLGGGEATVNKLDEETWGKGGRAQEMAVDYMISKISNQRAHDMSHMVDVFLAGGTDGQDGPTDVAACLASHTEWFFKMNHQDRFNLNDLKQAKSSHDSYNFWLQSKPDWLIRTGLTGTNVMDLYIYMLAGNK